jgi:hypothetical protein
LFDEHQTPPPKLNILPPAIVIACGGAGILFSFGLCGTQASFQNQPLSILSKVGLILFIASVLGLAAGILWLIVLAIIGISRAKS